MIKSITNFLIIFIIFQQLKSQISQIDQNGYNAFCDETLHLFMNTVSVTQKPDHTTLPITANLLFTFKRGLRTIDSTKSDLNVHNVHLYKLN